MSSALPPLQSLLEKLMLAGWVSSTGTKDIGEEQRIRAIGWTDDGLRNMAAIGILLEEITERGGRVTDAELLCLRALAQDQGDSLPPQ